MDTVDWVLVTVTATLIGACAFVASLSLAVQVKFPTQKEKP